MATGDQIKSLIKSCLEENRDRFLTTALQVAANEARQGHGSLAKEIRDIIDKSKSNIKVLKFTPDLSDLIWVTTTNNRLSDLVVSSELKDKIDRILKEYFQRSKLLKHGLSNRRKILLVGPSGTGKTMTASVVANELKLPFYTIQMDKMVNKYMGETSAKLRQVFESIKNQKGVFLFDEFDAIGAERGLDNEVGEMRRVLNSFLQFIENDDSESIIIAATNNIKLLDQALFRRFNDILYYQLPTEKELPRLFLNCLGKYKGKFDIDTILPTANGLNHAEITQACNDAIKEIILNDKKSVTQKLLTSMLKDRKKAYNRG